MTIKQFLRYVFRGYYTDGDHIVHRKHGRYPREVPFFQGMTIYPGQTAIVALTEEQIVEAIREYQRTGKPVELDPTSQTRH